MKLIVPSKAETACTGFILAGEDTHRRKVCRVEVHSNEIKCFFDGETVRISASPISVGRKLLRIAKQLALITADMKRLSEI
jgi:hypothetical protein